MRNAFTIKTSLVALAATLAVAGCNKAPTDAADNAQVSFALPELPATLPLAAGTGTPIAYAPEASALADAEPLRAARVANPQEAYGYADAAYEYTDALGDAPPDYAFDYDGAEPWAWQGYDNSLAFAEPIDDGYRTYYYRPGATEPYFIRDPYYSYGFAGGLLAVIYAADGGIVPYADYGPRLAYASRYYARGRDLYGVSRRGRRLPIYASSWRAQSPIIFAARTRWGAGRAHQPAWGAYHNANLVRQQRYWREETIRRRADSRRFAEWRASDFRTPAPPRAIPAAWSNAKWARDDTKFRPAGDNVRQAVLRERQQAARQDERAAAAGQRQAQERVAQRQALRQDAKPDRQPAKRQQQREQAQSQPQRERQQDRAQIQRQQEQRRQQAERQQERTQAQQPKREQRAQEQRQQDRAPARRQQAQRQQQAERQQQRAAQQQPKQRQQPATRVEQKRDQAAERQQAARAQQGQQPKAAQREQRQQAQQAQRQQAQATRKQSRPEPRQQPERARQQPQPQAQPRPQAQERQEARQERQAARQEKHADRPNRQ